MKICLLALLLVTAVTATSENKTVEPEKPLKGATDIFLAGTTELKGVPDSKTRYGQFREPGIVVTNSGRAIIVAQARDHSKWPDRSGQDLAVKWSDDNGKTWSNAIKASDHGNHSICPQSVVYDKIKDTLHVLYSVHEWDYTLGRKGSKKLAKADKGVRQYQISSSDNGETWSKPRNISKMFNDKAVLVVFGSGRGIQLQHGKHKGRLVISGGTRYPKWGNNAFYSDDHGKTWKVSDNVPKSKTEKINARNEAKIAELADGSLIMHCRAMPVRAKSYSKDGGQTWSPYQNETGVEMASCNGALISHLDKKSGKTYLVASGPAGPGRMNGMVWVSEDGGKTWPHRKKIIPRTIAYSTLATLADGTIAVVYESEVYLHGSYKHLRMLKFNISDIIGHQDPMPKEKFDPNEGTYVNP
jgi:sialidase-1